MAAIDCGTNSIRLLVADAGADGSLRDVHREMRIVRLGQGVDRTGRLAPEALERTRDAVQDYAAVIASLGAERVRMVATSATRDASNRGDFVAAVRDALGVDPEVISGAEEAALSFAGAASVRDAGAAPLLVADIGGGSSELVRGGGGTRLTAHSMDVGSVRMTERHLHDDPPTPAQVAVAEGDVRTAIDAARADVSLEPPVTLVGVAGTVTTIAALALGLRSYSRDAIHGAVVTADQVRAVTRQLLTMTHDQRAELPVMHPGRVDIIGAGAIILRTLLDEVGVDDLVASEHDILDGIALSLIQRPADPTP